MQVKEVMEEDAAAMAKLVQEIGIRRAATRLGVNGKTLRGILVKYGHIRLKDIPPKVLQWADMRAQGMSYAQIGQRFEMTRQSIHGALTYWGLT